MRKIGVHRFAKKKKDTEEGSAFIEAILAVTFIVLVVAGVADLYLVNVKMDVIAEKKMQAGEYLTSIVERAIADAKKGVLPQETMEYKPTDLPWLTVSTNVKEIMGKAYSYEVTGFFDEGGVRWKISLARILYLP